MKPILLIPAFLAGAVVAIAAAPSVQFNPAPAVADVEVPTVEQSAPVDVAPVKFAEPKGAGGIVSMADQLPNPEQGQETLKPKSQTATEHSDAGKAGKVLAEKHGIRSVTTERVVLPETPASIEGGYIRTQTVFNVVYNDGSKATNPLLAGGAEYGWGDVEILSQILHYSQEKKAMEQR